MIGIQPGQTHTGILVGWVDVQHILQADPLLIGVVHGSRKPEPALLTALIMFHYLHQQRASLVAVTSADGSDASFQKCLFGSCHAFCCVRRFGVVGIIAYPRDQRW
jgi:hypothetical protein